MFGQAQSNRRSIPPTAPHNKFELRTTRYFKRTLERFGHVLSMIAVALMKRPSFGSVHCAGFWFWHHSLQIFAGLEHRIVLAVSIADLFIHSLFLIDPPRILIH
jgi:hypothetical protein